MATPEGRRRATRDTTVNVEHLPAELLAHQLRGAAACAATPGLIDLALREGWPLDAERIDCPMRIVWGTEDRVLRWPGAAAGFRRDRLPHADWVVLDGVGHCPQLDVPIETAQLVLGFAAAYGPARRARRGSRRGRRPGRARTRPRPATPSPPPRRRAAARERAARPRRRAPGSRSGSCAAAAAARGPRREPGATRRPRPGSAGARPRARASSAQSARRRRRPTARGRATVSATWFRGTAP